MKYRLLQILGTIVSVILICFSSPVMAETYRLGVPKDYIAPAYNKLFDALEQQDLVVGRNLEIIPIDLTGFESEEGKERIRQEIARECDLFFTTGTNLPIMAAVELQSPLLFISLSGPQYLLPSSMQENSTGFYRDTIEVLFQKTVQFLPEERRKKLGLIYFRGSTVDFFPPSYIETCKKLGVELIIKEYADTDDIERVMREFKELSVGAVALFPPAMREHEYPELIKWQKRLKLPIVGQNRIPILRGLVGGPAMDSSVFFPKVAEYAAKMLRGRNPSQLPVKYFSSKYVVNMQTVQLLGIQIPQNILDQAEIVP